MSSSDDNVPTTSDKKRTRGEPKTYHLSRRNDKHKAKKLKTLHYAVEEALPAYIFDNGAYTVKAGVSASDQPLVIPNCIMKGKSEKKRLFIGNQIDDCRDLSGLFYLRPCEKGYITKWDIQKSIWDYVFSKNVCPINKDNPIIMTQPILNFKNVEEYMDEIFFEEYEVKSLYRTNPTDYAYFEYITKTAVSEVPSVIIDSGFSFTHIVPYVDGRKYMPGIKRIDIGGKFLTNVLRETISYRMYDVMEETHVINQVKEDACFVCEDIAEALNISKLTGNENSIVRNYVLPDFHTLRRGYMQDPHVVNETDLRQILRLNNERFAVPEILFRPTDIEMKSCGIGEALLNSIRTCPQSVQRLLCKNIVVIGGNANFPGFKNRLYKEIRPCLPDSWEINILIPEKPITYAWNGAKSMSQTSGFKKLLVTKEEYLEHGSNYTRSKFNNQWISDFTGTPHKVTVDPGTSSKTTRSTTSSASGRTFASLRSAPSTSSNKPSSSSAAATSIRSASESSSGANKDKNQAESDKSMQVVDISNSLDQSKKKVHRKEGELTESSLALATTCDLDVRDYFKRSYV